MSTAHEAPVPTLEAAGGYGPPGGAPPGYGGPPGGGYGGPPGGSPPGGYGGYGGGAPPGGGYGGPPPGGGQYGGPPAGGLGGGYGGGGPKMHPLAIASAVCGVLSFPACCCWFYGFPMPIAAIICGIMALTKIKANPQAYSGAILCYVGMACGGFSFFMSMVIHMTALGEGFRHRYGRRF